MIKSFFKLFSFIAMLALAAMACTWSGAASTTQGTASISGKITADLNGNGTSDSDEGPLDNVIVSISGCGENRTALSGGDGSFHFSGLPTGVCILEVTKGGWTYSASYPTPGYPIPVTADASQPTALVIFMHPEDQTQVIPVTGDPTATQLPIDIPLTATPDMTATPGQAMVSATDRDVNCRFGPSTKYSPTDALLKGKTVPITGKTDDSSWWQVDGPSYGGGKCFVSASVTQTSGDLSTVPVVQAPQAYVTDVQFSVKVIDGPTCNDTNIKVSGTISANGPTVAEYRFILDGPYSEITDYTTLEFTEAGELPFQVDGGISKCGDYSLELQVSKPNSISASDEFSANSSGTPVIHSVGIRKDRSSGGLVIYQDIVFKDSHGDVTTADWELISTTASGNLTVRDGTVTKSSAEQKAGTFHTGRWGCGNGKYSITLSVTLIDKVGNHSDPYIYTMVCD